MRLGIDASNIRQKGQSGGTLTHLAEILRAGNLRQHSIEEITVWCGEASLKHLPNGPNVHLIHERQLDGPLPSRLIWQQNRLRQLAAESCDALFAPGGLYLGSYRPFVAMSQNLLPFESTERSQYGFSWPRIKFHLLELGQTTTFRRATGTIFLTETARQLIENRTGVLNGKSVIIPHGIADRFRKPPRRQQSVASYSANRPFRWLYVSTVAMYKHQWNVVEAVAALRDSGLPVALDIVGPADQTALRRLLISIERCDPQKEFIHYHGHVPYEELPAIYHGADGFAFASSCENMPSVLLEAMASGLPIACSKHRPMPEILGDAGCYFDPREPREIADTLLSMMEDVNLRNAYAWSAYKSAQKYTWDRCANEVYKFIADASRHAESY